MGKMKKRFLIPIVMVILASLFCFGINTDVNDSNDALIQTQVPYDYIPKEYLDLQYELTPEARRARHLYYKAIEQRMPRLRAQEYENRIYQNNQQSSNSKNVNDYLSIPLRVLRIIDGDTIVLEIKEKAYDVRLIGVDTPETKHPQRGVEYYGPEASLFLTNLLKGERVRCHFEGSDKYKRQLAYVYREPDLLFVNAEIIRQGYGRANTKYSFSYKEYFVELEKFAKNVGKGLWALKK
jgi:endonuclease YncB( thermonuclease family)